ncbi:cysteine/glutathione ABC transporter ATP-binding protein/permease CydC [Aliivibrio fischeri]|uniref:Glutathione/L-cysteine transport system ATP-binding/permease protein CydC n=1 Tax=Aliivibrio fischeri TaxID=668 RepID=A0A510UK56_ALIFS|nr:cysteine/glutathione ABC transporter ATP-binding protein/permease CydC [Aliivibrio fischeri]MUK31763.1 cysteine/glutathione ABC transporter ATP-binding protein/permease CydC [Aliivibrio fischeri]MUK49576.1 cysteine/glutathione ABC transporter ATP-binding protein/permease CydC [Aliivibrio fischeri]MUK64888.1 cysteine/glutathione ABC transporter ATP-binding protein/permease CydC [Aliivibrio fischeri]GEK15022.1 cysteine/glutathione ABC transporter ATP-binding protein/permease CydC [Aliivibrio f
MRDLLPYIKLYKKHWFGLTLGMLLSFATLFASIGLLTISGWFISASAIAGLTIARETFNYMLPAGAVRGFSIGRTAGRWGERVVSHNATFKLLTELRIFFFKKLIPLIPGRFSKLRDADLLNRLVADVDAMDHVYLRLVSPIIVGTLGIIGLTAFLTWFDITIGLTLGAILLSLLLIWPTLFYKLGKHNGSELTQNKATLRIKTLDWLQGNAELRIFGAEAQYRQRILDAQTALLANQHRMAALTGLANGLLLLANGWTLLLMLWIAGDGIAGMTPDPMVAMVAFATMASFELLMPIAGAFQYLGQTLSSARRLNEIITAEPDTVFDENGVDQAIKGNLTISNVDYQYMDADTNAINAISLDLLAGQKMAIVGQTGSGKSTLLQLLTRQWDPKSGYIAIDGVKLPKWKEANLRSAMSVVSQRVDILNGSLRDNLLLADDTASDEKLTETLNQVGLEDLTTDEGLNAWLGDGGRQLSGGERRRIGIARALLHDAPIVLLDEPTEGLDQKTEQQIMSVLNKHIEHKTVVFITHRLVNLEQMDHICLMDHGEIVEQGTHDSLLSLKGAYHQLWQRF